MKEFCRKGRMKGSGKRWLAILMSICLIGTMIPISARAETDGTQKSGYEQEEENVSVPQNDTKDNDSVDGEDTADNTSEPGDDPAPSDDEPTCTCSERCTEDHLNSDCPVCGKEGAGLSQCEGKEQTKTGEEQTKPDEKQNAECTCSELCTEDHINTDCPVCGADDADLYDCKGKPDENDEAKDETAITITSWQWIDEEEYLDPETGSLALPFANKEHPAYFDDITAFLPTQILATVENTEDTEAEEEDEDETITLGDWSCDNYPEEGAYQGSYTFTAALPEGYALSEEAEALEVLVELGGAQQLSVTGVSYRSCDANGKNWTTLTCASATEVTSTETTWGTGNEETWYVVQDDVTIGGYVTVKGNVHLILTDNSSLNVYGILVISGNSLTIYDQSEPVLKEDGTPDESNQAGKLTANAYVNTSGIGGYGNTSSTSNAGTITINGGVINATGGANAAGIGGGNSGAGGNIIINGGAINATGGNGGAGIGGGNSGAGGNIIINDGAIKATGNARGAGIGGGSGGDGGTITINGGVIDAIGGSGVNSSGAGIGGGSRGDGGTITITGGTVKATSGTVAKEYSAAGIGRAYGCTKITSNNIIISGGVVTATSYNNSDIIAGSEGSFSTGTNGTAVIFAGGKGIYNYDNIDKSDLSGIIFIKGDGTVYGNQTLESDLTISSSKTLNVQDSSTLTVNSGGNVTNEGTIHVQEGSTLTVSDGGNVTNNGTIKVDGTMDQASAERVVNNPPQYRLSVTDGNVFNKNPEATNNEEYTYYINYKDSITVIANEAPTGKGLIGWDVTGVAYTPQRTSPLEFNMPANVVSVKSKYADKAVTPNISITTFTAEEITIQALTATDTYGDAEYSIDGTNWQTSNTFTGLEADTTYIVRARYLGNDNYAESDAGSKEVKTKKWAEEITEPTGLTATYGQKLEDIEFEEGSGWSWKEPTTAVSVNKSEYEAQFAPADTADYDYSKLTGYRLDAGTVYIDWELSVEVSKATPTMTWGETSQSATYTGTEIATGKLTAPTVTLVNSETYTGTINYSYRAKDSSVAFTSGLPTDLGTYEVKASIAAGGNYTAACTASTMMLTIDWLNTDAVAVLTDQNNATLSGESWWAQSVTFTAPTGFTISNSVDGTYGSSFDYDTQTGANGTEVTYYLKDTTSGEIAQKTANVRIDRTAPTWPADGGISIKNNRWKEFLNTISFGLFFKETLEVKASAADDLSGVASYWYYVDETGRTTVLSSAELANKNFMEIAGSGTQKLTSLDSDNKYVVYAYAVDAAGNKSDYVCTNGVVLDTTAPTISDITTPSKETMTLTDTSAKISFTGSEAGTCFYMVKKISEPKPTSINNFATSSEDKGMTVWTAKTGVSSVEMTTEAKQITLSNLSPNTKYKLYLAAVDQAGNSSLLVYIWPFTTCKTMPTITTNPSISGTYGQKVEEMTLADGVAKVGSEEIRGTWELTDSNKANIPEVGTTDTYQVTFTPDASYNDIYDTVIVPVKPTVNKRAITVTAADKTKTYGQANPELTFTITEGVLVSGDDNTALGITLTCAADTSSPVKAGGYAITGTTNSANYQVTVIPGVLTIEKATPTITASNYTKTYGDIKFFLNATDNSAEASLQYAVTESKDPSGSVVEKDAVVTVDARGYVTIKGAGTAKITASLPETANYNAASREIAITVNKATNAPNMPGTTISAANRYETVGAVPLPTGWAWKEADRNKGLTVNTPVQATAEYTGADKANYENITVTVAITRSDCDHVAGEILYTGTGEHAPTCTVDGLGHRKCTICGEIIESGIIVKAAHRFSSAWTIDVPATKTSEGSKSHHCTVCGEKNDITVIPKLPSSSGGDSGNSGGSSGGGSGSTEDSGNAGGSTDTGNRNTNPGTVKPTVTPGTPAQGTNPPPGTGNGSKPGSKPVTNTGETTEAPFIKGENGKEGWDVIRDEVNQTQEGKTVTVDMNDSTVVPGNVLDEIKGKDITIVFDMGNGITWSVNGQSITADRVSDIDFTVKTGTNTIPVDIISNVTGERYSTQISLSYDGEFGFTAVLSINMDAENAGLYANLFYYNEKTGELEFICADEIAADGTAELTFTHASDYAIVIDTEPMDKGADEADGDKAETSETGNDSTQSGDGSTQNGTEAADSAWNPLWLIIVGAVVIVIGLGVFVVRKKKKSEDE